MILTIARLALAVTLLVAAAYYRFPLLVVGRSWMLAGLVVLPPLLVVWEVLRRRKGGGRWRSRVGLVALLTAIAALTTTLVIETRFQWMCREVLAAEPERLARLGRHVLVGYRSADEIRALVRHRAIAGVFLTARNVLGKDAAAIRREMESFRELRQHTGEPPLWIASDEEGGPVSRLSPPLHRQSPLSSLAEPCGRDRVACEELAGAYGEFQGLGLAALGVNLNFAPVIDLDHHVSNPDDRYSRISQRAISSDPAVVAAVADAYCLALAKTGVHCTLKHFPGLGRVWGDTHLGPARLDATPADLAASDWIPFRKLMAAVGRFTMLAHVRLMAIDPERPASISKRVVTELLRGAWGHDGPLVTDDFSMLAIHRSRPGTGGAAVEALNAGVDLVLVSYDADQFYVVMSALLRADREGRLDPEALRRSEARLRAAQ
jgi:beta-N-acetylhexosaminidase